MASFARFSLLAAGIIAVTLFAAFAISSGIRAARTITAYTVTAAVSAITVVPAAAALSIRASVAAATGSCLLSFNVTFGLFHQVAH